MSDFKSPVTEAELHAYVDGELPGDDQEGVAEIAAFIQGLHLFGAQVTLFRGKQGVGHLVLLAGLPG